MVSNKISVRLEFLLERAGDEKEKNFLVVVKTQGRPSVEVDAVANSLGIDVRTRVSDDLFTASATAEAIRRLADEPWVVSIDGSRPIGPAEK